MERYERNIALNEIGSEGQKKLLGASVLICGCGGLGSGVISSLASLGVGKLGLLDFDRVELSNLNRQFIHNLDSIGELKVKSAEKWVKNYNKDIKTETFALKLSKENFKKIVPRFDIIADCFDSFESKFLLNDIVIQTGKPLIHAGVTGFRGQIMTIIPKKTPCLRCVFGSDDTPVPIEKGVASPAVSTVSAIQTMEILKTILGMGETLENKILIYDGLNLKYKISPIKACESCICQK